MQKFRSERVLATVVKKLKELRKLRGFSHDTLAKAAGVTRPAISHIENGKRKPSMLMCLRLAKAMDVELSEILRASEKEHPRG